MWEIQITLKDERYSRSRTIKYLLKELTTFKDLFKKLPFLFPEIKNVPRTQLQFKQKYLDIEKIVENLNIYILFRDIIEIIVFKPSVVYSLCAVNNTTIIKTKKIEEVYEHYHSLEDKKFPIIVKKNDTIIDVLDNPQTYLNDCINRLVLDYEY